jgi:FkbM family methyltransferase
VPDRLRFVRPALRLLRAPHQRARVRRAHAELTEVYSSLIRPGDLVFDIGAHVGDRTVHFLELGARVVAVEPQPSCVEVLRERVGDRAVIVPMGLADEVGRRSMAIATTTTVSTMEPEWVSSTTQSGRFTGMTWDSTIEVEVTTLDVLIDEHGTPAFVKVDVEGFEPDVLAGLGQPVGAVSFEFINERPEATEACVRRLHELGLTKFNYSNAWRSASFALERWVSPDELLANVRQLTERHAMGDIYARSTQTRRASPTVRGSPRP